MISVITKYLGLVIGFFRVHKGKWIVFVLLIGFFFLIRFPYDSAVSVLLNKTLRSMDPNIHLSYNKFYFSLFGPSLVFDKPRIQFSRGHYLKVNQIRVQPSYRALLSLKPGGVFIFKWKTNELVLIFRKINRGKLGSGVFFGLQTVQFNPSVLRTSWPLFSKVSGVIDWNMEIAWSVTGSPRASGFWNMSGKDLHVQALSYTFPGTIGTISLPTFHWGKLSSNGTIKKDVVSVSDLSLGSGKDSFQVKTRGIVALDLGRKAFTNRRGLFFNHYDIGLEILADEDLKSKLYFLDLFLSSVEIKIDTGSRYLARIKGNRANFFNLSSVSKLPTLQEIQNPDQ